MADARVTSAIVLAMLAVALPAGVSAAEPAVERHACASMEERIAGLDPGPPDRVLSQNHAVPELEAMLPQEVAGRRLATWSTSGEEFYEVNYAYGDADLRAVADDLVAGGLDIADVHGAVAGRWDSDDPPYLITATRMSPMPAVLLPLEHLLVSFPGAGDWSVIVLGGRDVLVGTEAMVEQSEHQVGRPYVYDVGDIRFTVVTDDEAWAEEAISRLCPDPAVEGLRSVDGRVDRPDLGFSLQFPSGWGADSVVGEGQQWFSRWIGDTQAGPTLLLAFNGPDIECVLSDMTEFAQAPQGVADLGLIAEEAAFWARQDPTIVDFTTAEVELAVGQAVAMHATFDGFAESRFAITDGTSWYMFQCSAAEAPLDRWAGITESISFPGSDG